VIKIKQNQESAEKIKRWVFALKVSFFSPETYTFLSHVDANASGHKIKERTKKSQFYSLDSSP
jgi:hypothetical protein